MDSTQIENEPIIKRADLYECLECNKVLKNDMFNHIKIVRFIEKNILKLKK